MVAYVDHLIDHVFIFAVDFQIAELIVFLPPFALTACASVRLTLELN
jgi:hypothetical protein